MTTTPRSPGCGVVAFCLLYLTVGTSQAGGGRGHAIAPEKGGEGVAAAAGGAAGGAAVAVGQPPRFVSRSRKWQSDRTPAKGELYHWIKWPHAGLSELVAGRDRGAAMEGPVQNTGQYLRGVAGQFDDRKQFLEKEPYSNLDKIGDQPNTARSGGLPVPCDTPFKCKARVRGLSCPRARGIGSVAPHWSHQPM